MKNLKSLFLIVLVMCAWTISLSAQSESLDFLRSTGKIYSVIAVIVIVLLGIGFFMYRMDKKLTKLENQINNEQ